MGILDRIMGVNKPKDKLDLPELKFGNETDSEPNENPDFGDSTPGLAGTGDLGSMNKRELPPTPSGDETIYGPGHEDVKMEPFNLNTQHKSFSRPTMHEQTVTPQGYESNSSKENEIISIKLDSLKTQLDMINNRLSNIEMRLDDIKRRGGW